MFVFFCFPQRRKGARKPFKMPFYRFSFLLLCVFAPLRETLSSCRSTSSDERLPRESENASDPVSNGHRSENRCVHVSTSTQDDRSTQTSGAPAGCVPGAAALRTTRCFASRRAPQSSPAPCACPVRGSHLCAIVESRPQQARL